ncbi:DUF4255 domain-containing protein [Streptomyces sp. NPDC057743]|uniref:DUF4255 domain-containing protein n=1 Tax=Streptomyces sp. NPDC057743 TaxID=3346236 RepID=UPI00369A0718
MFHLVDKALKELVTGILEKAEFSPSQIDVDFKAPAENTAPQACKIMVGLYLYDVREDLTRRTSGTIRSADPSTGKPIEHDPPRYARLSYMATTWANSPLEEHEVLAALHTEASKTTLLPVNFPPEITALDRQAHLTVATPTTEDRVLTELWSALGTPLRPFLSFTVTTPLLSFTRLTPAPTPRKVRLTAQAEPKPKPPAIGRPADRAVLGGALATVSGTAEQDATVQVRLDGHDLGHAVRASDRSWSLSLESPAGAGEHKLTAEQRTRDDGPWSAEASCSVTVLGKPVITPPKDPNQWSGTLSGTVTPDTYLTVEIRSGHPSPDGALLGSQAPSTDGAWTVTVPKENLTPGTRYVLYACQMGEDAQWAVSDPVTVTVQRENPDPLVTLTRPTRVTKWQDFDVSGTGVFGQGTVTVENKVDHHPGWASITEELEVDSENKWAGRARGIQKGKRTLRAVQTINGNDTYSEELEIEVKA